MYNLIVCLCVALALQLSPEDTATRKADPDWAAYSDRLVCALSHPNEGVRASSLRHMLTYFEDLELGEAVPVLNSLCDQSQPEEIRNLANIVLTRIEMKERVKILPEKFSEFANPQ